ncbi:MAG: dTMP kinase [Agarilytica sp.]
MKGKFITLEGTEGVGKSTNLSFIEDKLRQKGVDVVVTREPGGTPLSEELREILLANRDEPFDATAELLVIFAARAQHLNQVILPALSKGQWVLSDRFTDATYAYQGFGRGLSLDHISLLESLVQKNVYPDATFILDIDVELGLQRASNRAELDRFENEKIEFFQKVRAGYAERAAANPDRYHVVDAGKTLPEVQSQITKLVDALFKQ